MSRPQCKGCKAIIAWVTMRSGRPMPVDPDLLTEYLTDRPVAEGSRGITLVTPDGAMVSGYQGSVITPGAREVKGHVPNWATCSTVARFKR